MAKRKRQKEQPSMDMAGYDGSRVLIRERPTPGTRQVQQTAIRCRPGTFEWRYARAKPGTLEDALYLAGNEFARLWERAGADGPGTVDWRKEGTSQWRGLPDPRIAALEQTAKATRELGMLVTARLFRYVVKGQTAREVASGFNQTEREMAIVLASDLEAAARHLGYLGDRRVRRG